MRDCAIGTGTAIVAAAGLLIACGSPGSRQNAQTPSREVPSGPLTADEHAAVRAASSAVFRMRQAKGDAPELEALVASLEELRTALGKTLTVRGDEPPALLTGAIDDQPLDAVRTQMANVELQRALVASLGVEKRETPEGVRAAQLANVTDDILLNVRTALDANATDKRRLLRLVLESLQARNRAERATRTESENGTRSIPLRSSMSKHQDPRPRREYGGGFVAP